MNTIPEPIDIPAGTGGRLRSLAEQLEERRLELLKRTEAHGRLLRFAIGETIDRLGPYDPTTKVWEAVLQDMQELAGDCVLVQRLNTILLVAIYAEKTQFDPEWQFAGEEYPETPI